MNKDPKLIIMPNMDKFGKLVHDNLKLIRHTQDDMLIPIHLDRFSNAEAKATLKESVRGEKIFILSDVGNYGKESEYKSRGMTYLKSPDDHFQDLKRAISAAGNKYESLHVVTPLLYESRQDKSPNGVLESLDCKEGLLDLENKGIDGIITFDAHNPVVCENVLQKASFDNFFPTYQILYDYIMENKFNKENALVIAPDKGAISRAHLFATILGVDIGVFDKRRDYSKVIDGKNPIVEHNYFGQSVDQKNLIIVDDMIASGKSVIDTAYKLKRNGAKQIDVFVTFPLFTDGEKSIKYFNDAYSKGIINKIYSTNLTYVPEEVKHLPWYHEVDLSIYLAEIIDAVFEGKSVNEIDKRFEKKLRRKIQGLN